MAVSYFVSYELNTYKADITMRSLLVSQYVKSKFNYPDKHSARYDRRARHVNLEAKCPLLKTHLNQNWTLFDTIYHKFPIPNFMKNSFMRFYRAKCTAGTTSCKPATLLNILQGCLL
jgi:hypothetical protein